METGYRKEIDERLTGHFIKDFKYYTAVIPRKFLQLNQ